MFINNFDDHQKGVYLYFAEKIAIIDGRFLNEEKAFLEEMSLLISSQIKPQKAEINELPVIFSTKRTRVSFLLEIIKVAYCDRDYAADEQELSEKIADAFGFAYNEYMDLVTWVAKYHVYLDEANQFMEN